MTPYAYKVIVLRVIDGDTLVVDIDLGFGVWLHDQHLRLYDFDAPEVHGKTEAERAHAQIVTELVRSKTDTDRDVYIRTYKDNKEKYGRWLVDVSIDGEDLVTFLKANDCTKRPRYE